MKASAPARKTALICLLLFILGMIGFFIPLGHIAYIGPVLYWLNKTAVYLLMGGYGLLLLSVYVL